MGKHVMHGHELVRPDDCEERMRRDGHCALSRQEVVREFSSAMEMLHWCHGNRVFRHTPGSSRAMEHLYLGQDGNPGTDYHRIESFAKFRPSAENLAAMRRALARYLEILHYLREVEPEWVKGDEFHYADNSVERHDTNKYGQTRRVMIKQPSGDACF